MTLCHRIGLRVLCIGCLAGVGAAEVWSATLQEARTAYERKQYEQALALSEPLATGKGADAIAAGRLRVQSLVRLGRIKEAVTAYEKLEAASGQEDRGLLRDVAFGAVVAVLKDMREQMRGAGYTALKETRSDEALPYFEDGLTDGSGLVRALAVEGLGLSEAGRRSPRLAKALQDKAAMVRVGALKAMARSGDKAFLNVVQPATKDEQPMVRMTAWGTLAVLGDQDAVARLRESARAPNPEERGTALRTLGRLQDTQALPLMQEALHSGQPSVRGAAAGALGELGLPEGSPLLQSLAGDPVPPVRVAAILGLGEMGSTDAVPVIKQALRDSNQGVQAAAIASLLKMGRPFAEVGDTAQTLMRHLDQGIRASVPRALSNSRGASVAEAIPMIRAMLADSLPRPRIAAARALGHFNGSEALGALKGALRDQDDAVRATVGGALVRILDEVNHRRSD